MSFETERSIEAQLHSPTHWRRDHPRALGVVWVLAWMADWRHGRRWRVRRQVDTTAATCHHLAEGQHEADTYVAVIVGHELDRDSTVGRMQVAERLEHVRTVTAVTTQRWGVGTFAVEYLTKQRE